MALSQIQCLDDNHVNPRTNESKPEFLYCEDQRLALEALLRDGPEAFFKYLETRGLRGFLSDPEMETLEGTVEPFDPDSELFPESGEDDDPPLSQHYWPDLSDTSIPQMDLGWPDSEAYRGVTRTTVYSQPPLEGQAHIKEIVRKMIAQAQKVIAVVMDVFTDVDIFRDLLDAGFKRKVSVYILLERTSIPHFLSMCRRANMHAGHRKNLRVRCTDGLEFYTRSSFKVKGRLGHRFMFIDGDKAVSGSYSFTWMSSRLDKSLITVITGQAVDAFDRLFRTLYATSSSVDFHQVATEPEPTPEPLPQPTSVAPPPVAVARKLYNPKYALALGNSSPTPSAGENSPKKTPSPENSEVSDTKKRRRRRRPSKEAPQEAPPIHPGLINLEKASLISYLPTWPEPDPPSDVIGFINVRDANRPTQVHLQRHEMFGVSQAIKFSTPISMPKETLPEVATPRQITVKPEELKKPQPAQDKTKTPPTQVNTWPGDIKTKAEAPQQNSPASKALNSEGKLHTNTPNKQDANHNTTPQLNAHTPLQLSTKASTPMAGRPSNTMPAVTTNNPAPDFLLGSNGKKQETSPVGYKSHMLESNRQHTLTKMVLPHVDLHTKAAQPSEIAPNVQNPIVSSSSTSQPVSSTCLSTSLTTSPPLTSTALNPPLLSPTSSPPLTSTPPIPKPRTIQLDIKNGFASDSGKMPEFSIRRREASSERAVETAPQTSPDKEPQSTVPKMQNDSGSKSRALKDAGSAGNLGDARKQKQSETPQEAKNEAAVGLHDDRAGKQSLAVTNLETKSDALIRGAAKAESVNIQDIIPKDVEPKTLTSAECKLTPQKDGVSAAQAGAWVAERAPTGRKVADEPNENSKNVTKRKTYRLSTSELQTISYGDLTPQDKVVVDAVVSSKDPPHTPDSTHTSPAAQGTPITEKNNKHGIFQELISKARGGTHTGEKSLCLNLSDTHASDAHASTTPERELRSVLGLARTPTPDGFLSRSPTPDSRTHTPDPRSYTPDFKTPTSDISDGYVTPRPDSALSTASEEYFECSDSPLHEQTANRGDRATEVSVSLAQTKSPDVTTAASGLTCMNYSTALGTADRNSSSETLSASGRASISSLSSLLEERVKTTEGEESQEKAREADEKGNVAQRSAEVDSQSRGGEEIAGTAAHLKQNKDSAETSGKNQEAQPEAQKKRKVLSAAKLLDGGPEDSTNEKAEAKRSSTGDLKPKRLSSEGERADREKSVERPALGPSGAERRGRPQSSRDTEGQKLLHTFPRTSRVQQQDSEASSPSRPPRHPRPLSASQNLGPRPWASRQLSQTESKTLHAAFQAEPSSPRRSPSRPTPPASAAAGAVGSGPGRKQAEVPHGQQSLASRQPPSAQGWMRTGLSPNQYPTPRPQASFLHTHSSALLQPQSQSQTVSAQEGNGQEEGKAPFSFTFSKLYSLKGLKDRMNKPAQSKRGGTGSAVQGHNSTS